MTRARAVVPLYDEAMEELLHARSSEPPSSSAVEAPAAEGTLAARALAGHSPSARALANVGDSLAALAAGHAGAVTEPPASLRDRVLAAVIKANPVAPSAKAAPAPGLSPNEVLGRLHASSRDEPSRRALVERLGARGTDPDRATDWALERLIEQLGPLLGYEIVFVSTVVDDLTIHRVHRGFPAELGDLATVPRALSFCTHTVSAGEPFFVEDAASEAFFRPSELVLKLGARAYLGVPLFARLAPDQPPLALGALCGISRSPRPVFPEDIVFAQRFARLAQALVAHDDAELAALVADPRGYPRQVAPGPVVLAQRAFSDVVAAQRGRVAAGSVALGRLSPAAWPELRASLPESLVAGELEDGVGLLVPDSHPSATAVARIVGELERLG